MRTFLFVTILIFSLTGIVIVTMLVYSPKKTVLSAQDKQLALKKLLGREPIISEKIRANGTVLYDGKYIAFAYPAAAQDYPYDNENVKNSTSVLENKEFQESRPRYHFIVQVMKYSDQVKTYDDIPSVHLRRMQTDTYKESSIFVGKDQAVAFINEADGYEKDAFLLHGGLLYTFVITGGNPENEKIYNAVVGSVVIK